MNFFLIETQTKTPYLCINWKFLSILTRFLSCFIGRFYIGDMLSRCWIFIRWIRDSGEFVLPLLKRGFFLIMFLIKVFKWQKGWFVFLYWRTNITCMKFINKCNILHLYNILKKKNMFNQRFIAGFLDFNSWPFKLEVARFYQWSNFLNIF